MRRETDKSTSNVELPTAPRSERRFRPKTEVGPIASVGLSWLASLAMGAGVYVKFFGGHDEEPHRFAHLAPYLLGGGALVLLAIVIFGQAASPVVRVGDGGVAVEKGKNEIERIGWNQITRLIVSDDVITTQASGTSIAIVMKAHPEAAALFLAEARRRIPKRVEDDAISLTLPLDKEAGEVVPLEGVQVAGQRCKSSDKLIAFERDARLCARCGETYHKDSVPERCLTCGATLREATS